MSQVNNRFLPTLFFYFVFALFGFVHAQNALQFDGYDHIEVLYSSTNNTSTFTVECWVKVTGGSGNYRAPICSRYGPPTKGFNLYATAENVWSFSVGNGTGSWSYANGPSVVLNEWTHLAATYDGTTLRFYVNATLVSSVVTNFVANPSKPLRIGAGATEGGANYYFPGIIDEVRIWNYARSQSEIYSNILSSLSIPQTGLVSYYQFNNGTAVSSTGSNDGTIYSSPVAVPGVLEAPIILVTGTVNPFTYCPSTASAYQSFSVSGTNLSGDISIAAPTGFEVSTSSGSGYGSSITLTQSGGTISATTIYVRVSDTATGTPSGNVAITSSGATTKNVAVKAAPNNALSFDGANKYVDLGTPTATRLTNNFSVSAWIKTSSTAQITFFTNQWLYPSSGLLIGLSATGKLHTALSNGSTATIHDSEVFINDNNWHHLTVTFSSGTLNSYVDGVLIDSFATGLSGLGYNGSTHFIIGKDSGTGVENWNGLVDEVTIWNKVLTLAEVTTYMNNSPIGTETNLVGYWDFNNGIAGGTNTGVTTLYDRTSNQINGTLTNFDLTGTASNWVNGHMPIITGAASVYVGATTTLVNGLTGGIWSSSNTSIATVSSSGVVTGVSAGTTTITYTLCDNSVTKLATIINPTWNGTTSTDWNTASNWTPSEVPPDGRSIAIPVVTNYPALDANHSIGDINIANGATLNLNGKTLTIAGTITGTGTIKGSNNSSLVLNGTGAMGTLYLDQTTLGTTNTLQNLTINRTATGTVSLGNALNLIGVYTPTAGTLTTGGFLTLKSNASGTATIAAGTGAYISGNVTVERYLPAKRAYRFTASSVTTATSIYANWQENGSSAAGLGTQITGTGGATNGFDATTTNSPSMFTYNNTTGAWATVTNTNVNTLASGTPYRLMVRGDRTLSLATNTPAPTATTLRATGTLFTGSKTMSGSQLNQTAEGYSFIGNPYQAPVDIKEVLTSATGLYSNFYYVWDPTRATRGAYVTGVLADGTNTVTGSAVNQYLQPGQACFIKTSSAGIASLTFQESHKYTTATNQGVFRFANTNPASIRLTLYDTNAFAANDPALDGVLVFFGADGNNGVDGNDANKFTNLDETLATNNNGNSLSVESRAIALPTDIIPLNISQYRGSNYTLVAKGSNLSGNPAYLYDSYLATSTEIPQSGTVNYGYTVDAANALTTAADRFSIKFFSETLGIEDVKGIDFVINPNPSRGGSFNIVMPNSTADAKLIIYNTIGQEVYATRLSASNSNQIVLDKPLAGGVYYVKIISEGKATSKKLIIE